MTSTTLQKRTSTAGKIPATTDLVDGQIGLNLTDGAMFIAKNVGGTRTIVSVWGGVVTADPTSPVAGMIWYRSDLKQLWMYNGTTKSQLVGTAAQWTILASGVSIKTANYTITTADTFVYFNGSADLVATLPTAASFGASPVVIMNVSMTNVVRVECTGGDYIAAPGNGVYVYTLPPGQTCATFYPIVAGVWAVIAGNSATLDALQWANAPIQVLNSTTASCTAALSATTAAWPDVPTPGAAPFGALLVVCATWNSITATATLTDTSDNTWTPIFGSPINDGAQSCQMWYCINGVAPEFVSPAQQFTVTFNAAVTAFITATAFAGIVATSPLDVSASAAAGSGDSLIGPTIIPTSSADLLVCFTFATQTITGTPGVPALATSSAPDVLLQVGRTQVSGLTVSLPVTFAASAGAVSLIAAFKGLTTNIPVIGAVPGINFSTIAQGNILTAPQCTDGFVEITGNSGGANLFLPPVQAGLGGTFLYTGTGSTRLFDFTGGTLFQTLAQNQSVTLECDGTTWKITGQSNGIPAVGALYPAIVAFADGVGLGAAVTATTLYTVPAGQGGMYEMDYTLICTQQPTTSGTLGGATGVQTTFTDIDTNAPSTPVANPCGTQAAKPAVGAQISNANRVNAKAGSTISYLIGWTSSGATPLKYAYHVKLKYLGP